VLPVEHSDTQFWFSSTIEVARNRLDLALGRKQHMKPRDLKSMSVEELWTLHELISAASTRKINAEKAKLDQRLRQLALGAGSHNGNKISHVRRPYPQVYPKYRNPAEPSETWAGRGKKPRWLSAQLQLGKQIDDFRIAA
jgi:DNA-binding protein H-NS